jgi:hypothetical protein
MDQLCGIFHGDAVFTEDNKIDVHFTKDIGECHCVVWESFRAHKVPCSYFGVCWAGERSSPGVFLEVDIFAVATPYHSPRGTHRRRIAGGALIAIQASMTS